MDDPTNKHTILVVDDEPMVLKLARVMLERSGYTVCAAESGNAAVALCRDQRPPLDCAIIDYTMPGLDGRETLHALRNDYPDLPAIIASGYGSDHFEEKFANLAFHAVLQKPFRRDALLKTVRNALLSRSS